MPVVIFVVWLVQSMAQFTGVPGFPVPLVSSKIVFFFPTYMCTAFAFGVPLRNDATLSVWPLQRCSHQDHIVTGETRICIPGSCRF